MPKTKRPLAEVDGNVGASKAGSKRAHAEAGIDSSNENSANYETKTVAELSAILKDRSLVRTGKKADLIERLRSDDLLGPNTTLVTKARPRNRKPSPTVKNLEFKTICSLDESDDDEDDEDDEDPDSGEIQPRHVCGTEGCMANKKAEEHPEWKRILSTKGIETINHLREEAWKRNQDVRGEYHFNDFTGYGFQEVVENHLLSINREITKIKPNPFVLWYLIESFAIFLPGDGAWLMYDDAERLYHTLDLIGGAVHCTMKILEEHNFMKPESPIKNIGFILGCYLKLAKDLVGNASYQQLSWAMVAVEIAQEQGFVFKEAPRGIEDIIREFQENSVADDREKWVDFDWTIEFEEFKEDFTPVGFKTIGGRHYDLTKRTHRLEIICVD